MGDEVSHQKIYKATKLTLRDMAYSMALTTRRVNVSTSSGTQSNQ